MADESWAGSHQDHPTGGDPSADAGRSLTPPSFDVWTIAGPGPYSIDLIITTSVGTVRLTGEYPEWRGIHEVLTLVASAMPRGDSDG